MQYDINIPINDLEHLLNCLANQKFIHELPPDIRKESQKVIDDAWNKGMTMISPILQKNALAEEAYSKGAKKWNSDVDFINKKAEEAQTREKYGRFKWGQLILQEWNMYARLGEIVEKEEFDELCQRRGFDNDMKQYLQDIIAHMGLWEQNNIKQKELGDSKI